MKYLLTLLGILAFTVAWTAPRVEAANSYVGVKECAKCHKSKRIGKQFGIWEKTEHANAFKVLGTDEAKEAAKTVGVSGNPQETDACLVCHTTGFGVDKSQFGKKFKVEDGVECEACHGPGSAYKPSKVMKQIAKEHDKGDSPTAKEKGLIFPNENTCKRCHSQEITFDGKTYKNPKYKPFNYKEAYKKIEHPIP